MQSLLYNERGELVSESDPSGAMWTMVRDPTGAIVGKRDPLGYLHGFLDDVTSPEFDPLAKAPPAGAMAQVHGDAASHDFDIPRDGSLARELPESLRGALLSSEQAGRVVYVRNAQGLLVRKDRYYGDGSVRARRYMYDANGNLRHLRDADGGDWHEEFASWNQRTVSKDPLGHTTRFAYSKRDRMVRVEDALGTTTEYGWDLRDRLSEVKRHGKVRERYVYDAAGGLIEKRVPGEGAEATDDDVLLVSYKRGPLRTMLGRTTNADVDGFGVAESFTRDSRGRIIGAKYSDATGASGELTQQHDGAGRRLVDGRIDAGGTSSVQHRYAGERLLSTTVQLVEDGPVYRVKYHRPVNALTPAGTVGSALSSNALTLLIDPTDQMHRLQRVDAGVLRRDFASGTTEVAQYDSEGNCLAKASEGAGGVRRQRYLRSAEGDLLERQDEQRGAHQPAPTQRVTRYRYDKAHRLTGVQSPDGAIHEYAHDEAGNLLQKPGLSEGFVAQNDILAAPVAFDTSKAAIGRGNRLYRANGDRFHFDARDHVVAREGAWGKLSYIRDGLGRMRRIEWSSVDGTQSAKTWEAEYDALGRRVRKVVHRVGADGSPVLAETRFVWDGDRLIAEVLPEVIDADGATNGDARRPVRLYVYSDSVALVPMLAIDYASLSAPAETGVVHALFTDHRGAVERVEDMAGGVVWEADIGAYGEAVVSVGASTSDAPFHQPLRLVGQYFDEETQLCAHRYRSYSPELGRFLESDPIGLAGGVNVYAWPGCPLNVSDPLGLACPKERAAALESEQKRRDAGDAEALPEGGISMAARRREVDADSSDRSTVPDHGDNFYFDTTNSRYNRLDTPDRTPTHRATRERIDSHGAAVDGSDPAVAALLAQRQDMSQRQTDRNGATEQLGEMAADSYARERGLVPLHEGQGPGTFDRVYRDPVTGGVVIVEAKGGSSTNSSSRAGTGADGSDERYQQGTTPYRESVTEAMAGRDPDSPTVAAIRDSDDAGTLEYVQVSQPIDDTGGLGPIRVDRYGDMPQGETE